MCAVITPPEPPNLIDLNPPAPTFPIDQENNTTEPIVPNLELFQLSLQAATGHPSPRTLRFTATVYGHKVIVLVDSGSSHNITQPRIASFLHLPIQLLSSFSVMVGNDDYLHCTDLCKDIPLLVAQHIFPICFYVLPIQGVDVVLGVQWLQTLGPFVSDFTIPSMSFTTITHS